MAFTLKTETSRADALALANSHPNFSNEDWMIIYQTTTGTTPAEHGIVFSSNPGLGPVEINEVLHANHIVDNTVAFPDDKISFTAGGVEAISITKDQLVTVLGSALSGTTSVGSGEVTADGRVGEIVTWDSHNGLLTKPDNLWPMDGSTIDNVLSPLDQQPTVVTQYKVIY